MEIKNLKCSLTKNGAWKLWKVVKDYPPNEVLAHLGGDTLLPNGKAIHIDIPQARHNLGIRSSGQPPPSFWNSVRSFADVDIQYSVFLAIVLGHHRLIEAFAQAKKETMRGVLVRDVHLATKPFTNIAHAMEQFGLLTEDYHGGNAHYDLTPVFQSAQVASIAKELIASKLAIADWTGGTDATAVGNAAVAAGMHSALAVSEEQFVSWLGGTLGDFSGVPPNVTDGAGATSRPEFSFQPGHTDQAIAAKGKRDNDGDFVIYRRHELIKGALYRYLANAYGEDSVGTEVTVASGAIDVVLKEESGFTFYEVKQSGGLLSAIREALGQLLEYAFFPCASHAKKLVVVTTYAATDEVRQYLEHLRSLTGLPIFHATFDMDRKEIVEEV